MADAAAYKRSWRSPATGSRIGSFIACVIAIAVFWLAVLGRGVSTASVSVATAISALFLLAWYLESRGAWGPVSRLEVVLAWVWLILRTAVGIAGALLFLGLPITAAILEMRGTSMPDPPRTVSLVLSALLGVVCLWVGFAGWTRHPVRDLQLRKERKQRYGWPL